MFVLWRRGECSESLRYGEVEHSGSGKAGHTALCCVDGDMSGKAFAVVVSSSEAASKPI